MRVIRGALHVDCRSPNTVVLTVRLEVEGATLHIEATRACRPFMERKARNDLYADLVAQLRGIGVSPDESQAVLSRLRLIDPGDQLILSPDNRRSAQKSRRRPRKGDLPPYSERFESWWSFAKSQWYGEPGTKLEAWEAWLAYEAIEGPITRDQAVAMRNAVSAQSRTRKQEEQQRRGERAQSMKHVCRWIAARGWE